MVRNWYESGTEVVRKWYGSGMEVVRKAWTWYESGTEIMGKDTINVTSKASIKKHLKIGILETLLWSKQSGGRPTYQVVRT